MENGIYTFGLAFAHEEPLLVELGMLLDVFVAVFVMGIAIFHINREFDHIDTDRAQHAERTERHDCGLDSAPVRGRAWWPSDSASAGSGRALLLATAAGPCRSDGLAWVTGLPARLDGWLRLDAARPAVPEHHQRCCFWWQRVYALGYLGREDRGGGRTSQEGFLFTNAPRRTFTGCLLLFLATMTLVTVSQHFGLLWVAVEATTLASAPLIYFHRHHRSLEATWKYL